MKREEPSRAEVAAERITAIVLLFFCLVAAVLA
jgi:hypothetical protein